jgi:hypothetical protein
MFNRVNQLDQHGVPRTARMIAKNTDHLDP